MKHIKTYLYFYLLQTIFMVVALIGPIYVNKWYFAEMIPYTHYWLLIYIFVFHYLVFNEKKYVKSLTKKIKRYLKDDVSTVSNKLIIAQQKTCIECRWAMIILVTLTGMGINLLKL